MNKFNIPAETEKLDTTPFTLSTLSMFSTQHNQDIRKALETNQLTLEVFQYLQNDTKQHLVVLLSKCTVSDRLRLINKLFYIPNKSTLFLRILKAYYDHPATRYPGWAATYELVSRNYWWPKMHQTIAKYIHNCDTCTHIKPGRHAPYGLLKMLEVPFRH